MTTDTLITEEVRAYIGRRADPMVYEVDPSGVRLFARALGYTDPIHYDEAAAHEAGYRGLLAPFGYLGAAVYNPAARSGSPLRLPELPVKRRLNGGTELIYFRDVCAGDVLAATSTIRDIFERPGRTGAMVMIVIETDFRDQSGEVVARQTTTLIRY